MIGNIGEVFERLKSETFLVYKGLRFERTKAGFMHNGILCRDHHEMDILAAQEEKALEESINRVK